MTDKHLQDEAAKEARGAPGNMQKDPADWVTGDEPMTGAQKSYLKTLCEEAHQPFDETLTKAAASRRIDELQALTGRGARVPRAPGAPAVPAPGGVEPADESPLESLGRSVSEPVLGTRHAPGPSRAPPTQQTPPTPPTPDPATPLDPKRPPGPPE